MDAEDLLLKQAAHGFQVAAGGFNHLRDEVVIIILKQHLSKDCH